MAVSQDHPAGMYGPGDPSGIPSDEAVQKALEIAPRGAFALSVLVVAMLLAAWLAIYFAIFLPRGIVG